jgi:LysM repeat protein
MRKSAKLVIIIFTLCMLESCNFATNPDEVLTQYLNALDKGNYREAYGYIAAKDKAIKTADAYARENSATSASLLAEAFGNKRSFIITGVTIDANTATIAVTRTAPDIKAILGIIAGDASSTGFSEKDLKKLSAKEIRAKLQGKEIPLMRIQETYTMIREGENWKVYLDWKKQTEEKNKQDKIDALLSEANQLKRTNNLLGALDKYNQVLALDNDLPQAQAEKAEAEKEIKLLGEKRSYLKNIQLQNIKIEKQKPRGSDTPKESITGVIVNQGDRTLGRVKIAVYFLDREGKEIDCPALATEFFFRDENQPLTPMSKREFGFTIEGYAPPSWAGKVTVKITDIEFDTRGQVDKKSALPEAAATKITPATTTVAVVPPVSTIPKEAGEHNPRYHEVKQGETLYSIARHYDISVNEICRRNNLTQNQIVQPGRKLLVSPEREG